MATGDAVLFEAPSAGVFEVRVLSQSGVRVQFLITKITSRPGFAGAFITSDPSNTAFTDTELENIARSIDSVKKELFDDPDLLPEQIALLSVTET